MTDRIRVLILMVCAAVACGGALAAAVAASAQTDRSRSGVTAHRSASAPAAVGDDPAAVPGRLIAAARQGTGAGACELLTGDLRERLADPQAAGLDPFAPATWTPEGIARSCDAALRRMTHEYSDYPPVTGISLGPVRTLAATGDAAQLGVRVRWSTSPDPRFPDAVVLARPFVAREDGQWRIAQLGSLLGVQGDFATVVSPGGAQTLQLAPPRSLAEFPAYRRELAQWIGLLRRERAAGIRRRAAAETTVAGRPLVCAGRTSETRDPLRDVVRNIARDLTRRRLADQQTPRIDVRSATVRVGGGALCWEARLRRSPPAAFTVALGIEQGRPWGLGGSEIGVEVRDGLAHGWVDGPAGSHELAAGVSVTGTRVRVRVPVGSVRRALRPGRPFHWTLRTAQADPAQGVTGELFQWVDDVGERPRTPMGVLHDPVRRARATAAAADRPLRPAAVLRRFVDALDTRRAAAGTCEWVVPDLVELLATPELLRLDPLLAGSWSDANRIRGCGATLAAYNGYVEDCCNPEWRTSSVLAVRDAGRRGDVVHLRARIRHLFKDPDDDYVRWQDVFLTRGDGGAWRLATLDGVTQLFGRPPRTFAAFARRRARLSRTGERLRTTRAARVRDHLAFRAPLDGPPLQCSGRESGAQDPQHDVDPSDLGMPRRRESTAAHGAELLGAVLRTGDGRLCWELRLAGPPQDGLELTFDLSEPSPPMTDGGEPIPVPRPGLGPPARPSATEPAASSFRLRLDGGWAYAEREDERLGGMQPIPLRFSRVGGTLVVDVPAREAVAPVDVSRRFDWRLATYQGDPLERAASEWWSDALPDREVAGVAHLP